MIRCDRKIKSRSSAFSLTMAACRSTCRETGTPSISEARYAAPPASSSLAPSAPRTVTKSNTAPTLATLPIASKITAWRGSLKSPGLTTSDARANPSSCSNAAPSTARSAPGLAGSVRSASTTRASAVTGTAPGISPSHQRQAPSSAARMPFAPRLCRLTQARHRIGPARI